MEMETLRTEGMRRRSLARRGNLQVVGGLCRSSSVGFGFVVHISQVTGLGIGFLFYFGKFEFAGNETFERVASFGLTANLTVYLVKRYHMQQITAVNVNNIWSGTSSFAPLLGAFLADAYWGKFKTVAYGCIATFLVYFFLSLNFLSGD